MKIIKKNLTRALLLLFIFLLTSCSNVLQQINEKNREDYILSRPGVYDPVVIDKPDYVTHKFIFLEKYKVAHDWPYGFDICKYATMTLPKSMRDGTWYGSYRRLGDIFEYRGSTLQEVRVDGYPERSIDASYMSIDNHVKTWTKVDELGVERTYGYAPMCWQPLGGSSHTLVVRLYKRSLEEWRKALKKKLPDGVLAKKRIGNNVWLTQEFELTPSKLNDIAGTFKTWVLPIGDTSYTYTFQLGASSESLNHPRTHAAMIKIFRHLIESVRIESLSKEQAKQARAKVKKLIKEIEAYEARSSSKK